MCPYPRSATDTDEGFFNQVARLIWTIGWETAEQEHKQWEEEKNPLSNPKNGRE